VRVLQNDLQLIANKLGIIFTTVFNVIYHCLLVLLNYVTIYGKKDFQKNLLNGFIHGHYIWWQKSLTKITPPLPSLPPPPLPPPYVQVRLIDLIL
jgi:hypothetical protein